jgi:hypothetical protein
MNTPPNAPGLTRALLDSTRIALGPRMREESRTTDLLKRLATPESLKIAHDLESARAAFQEAYRAAQDLAIAAQPHSL